MSNKKTIFLGVMLMFCFMVGCKNKEQAEFDTDYNAKETNTSVPDVTSGEKEESSLYSVGDVLTMGSCEQDNNTDNGTEPIEWIVLDTDGGKTLLLSKYVLDREPYNIQNKEVTWYTSSIYQRLNNDFFNNAFNDKEKKKIVQSEYGKVFLLSLDETIKYFNMSVITETLPMQNVDYDCYYSQNALGIPTEAALENNIDAKEFTQTEYDRLSEKGITYDESVVGNMYVKWWLRTKVSGDESCANVVLQNGGLTDISQSLLASYHVGMRPAIWIDENNAGVMVEDEETLVDVTEPAENLQQNINGISRFYGYNLPLLFSLDYEYGDDDILKFNIEDKGEYYLVSGSLICPECISEEKLPSTGEQFKTGSGRGYTVLGMESYNNDQREKVILAGDDGQTYVIYNIPAFMIDAYTNETYYSIISENKGYCKTVFEKVVLRIEKDTVFTDGDYIGDTFDEAVKNGDFENVTWDIAYDIHFAENGRIDILTPSDIGSNGVMGWYGADTVIWRETLK